MRHRHKFVWIAFATIHSGCINHYHLEEPARRADQWSPSTHFLDGISAERIANTALTSANPTIIVANLRKVEDILASKTKSLERPLIAGIPTSRRRIYEAMSDRIDPRSSWAGGIAVHYIGHENTDVRKAALDVLAMLGPHAIPYLRTIRTAALADASTEVRLLAILAIMKTGIDYEFANDALRPYLDSSDSKLVVAALRVFSHTKATDASIELLGAIIEARSDDLQVVKEAVSVKAHLEWARDWMYSEPVPSYSW